jgi:hypothetical protein
MSGNDRHPDIKELVEKAMSLEDVPLQSLFDIIKAELARRKAIKDGLDVGERLQFDTTLGFIRQRTGLSEADALAMIRAHEPGRVRG